MEVNLIALAIPAFLVAIAVELVVARLKRRAVYRFSDAATDLACGVTQQVCVFFVTAALLQPFAFLYDHARLLTFAKSSPWPWVIAFVGVDLAYYWWHRLSHEVNFLWAVHVVHHQSEDYNLAVALRQAVFSPVTVVPFYAGLAVLGVPPLTYAAMVSLSTLYQFWIHTELVGRLGVVDRVINTPSAHRVHHAINPRYMDRNYAAVLMVWDRLFGTYEPETEPCVYGITRPLRSFNPLWAQVHYWSELFAVARKAPSFAQGVSVFFRSPAWHAPWLSEGEKPGAPEARAKYDPPASRPLQLYVALNFLAAIAATFSLMMWGGRLGLGRALALGALVLLSLLAWGGLLESRRWAWPCEAARLVLAGAWLVAL